MAEPGKPAFQLRKGEDGISVFDTDGVDPPLTETEILDAFRPGSHLVQRSRADIEAKDLILVPVPGAANLPSRLMDAHFEIRRGLNLTRGQFKKDCRSSNNMASVVYAHPVEVPDALVDAIRCFPTERVVEHCGKRWSVSPFDIYAKCPGCGETIKVRSFSGCTELEDVFDAFFEWMNQPGVEDLVHRRREAIRSDNE